MRNWFLCDVWRAICDLDLILCLLLLFLIDIETILIIIIIIIIIIVIIIIIFFLIIIKYKKKKKLYIDHLWCDLMSVCCFIHLGCLAPSWKVSPQRKQHKDNRTKANTERLRWRWVLKSLQEEEEAKNSNSRKCRAIDLIAARHSGRVVFGILMVLLTQLMDRHTTKTTDTRETLKAILYI